MIKHSRGSSIWIVTTSQQKQYVYVCANAMFRHSACSFFKKINVTTWKHSTCRQILSLLFTSHSVKCGIVTSLLHKNMNISLGSLLVTDRLYRFCFIALFHLTFSIQPFWLEYVPDIPECLGPEQCRHKQENDTHQREQTHTQTHTFLCRYGITKHDHEKKWWDYTQSYSVG